MKAEGLVERPRRPVARPSQEADSDEAELADKIGGRLHQRSTDPTAAVFGEDVKLVEVEEADPFVELWDACENR